MRRSQTGAIQLFRVLDDRAPITQNSMTVQLVKHAELEAAKIRKRAGVPELERFVPRDVADSFGIMIAYPTELQLLSSSDRDLIDSLDPKMWSGAGLPLPEGRTLILLNPHQTPERANVTATEEIAHVHFSHAPSKLQRLSNGLVKREYNGELEREAYWTAAATLLPSEVIARAVWKCSSVTILSKEYGASVELIEFRIKVLRLWRHYQAGLQRAS